MWQGSLNRKRLITGMTVILLLAVYTGMYIVLPAARQTAGKNETSESRQEENQTAQADSTKRTVVLDSGHGGFDPGKESSDGILEKHINLAIAERLKELLENLTILQMRTVILQSETWQNLLPERLQILRSVQITCIRLLL